MKVWRYWQIFIMEFFQLLIWLVPSCRLQLRTIIKICMQMHKWYLLKYFWSATIEFQFELIANAYTIWSSFFISILHVIKKLANFNFGQPPFFFGSSLIIGIKLRQYKESSSFSPSMVFFSITTHSSMDCVNAEAWDSFFLSTWLRRPNWSLCYYFINATWTWWGNHRFLWKWTTKKVDH